MVVGRRLWTRRVGRVLGRRVASAVHTTDILMAFRRSSGVVGSGTGDAAPRRRVGSILPAGSTSLAAGAGHAAWRAMLSDLRVRAALVVLDRPVLCPYRSLILGPPSPRAADPLPVFSAPQSASIPSSSPRSVAPHPIRLAASHTCHVPLPWRHVVTSSLVSRLFFSLSLYSLSLPSCRLPP